MLTETLLAPAATRLTPALGVVRVEDLVSVLITTLAFAVFGLIAFAVAYFIILKATPFSIRKEIEEDQNVALAVVIGAVILGIALIIAAAIQG
ncbi:MAG TPA: DUF350 domain-containing protein [Pyrinomonadaceae bacterium]|nr:DUF350 domain-containing protein [Pyrinomonadaceae bacterium]